jgi:hypothetical protein
LYLALDKKFPTTTPGQQDFLQTRPPKKKKNPKKKKMFRLRRKEELIRFKRETNSLVSPQDDSLLVSFSEEKIEENDP